MKPSELLDAMHDVLETKVEAFDFSEPTARSVSAASKTNRDRIRKVRELREAYEQLAPGVLFSKLGELEHQLVRQQTEIGRGENNLVAAAGPTPEENELAERIKDSLHREQQLCRASLLEAGGVQDMRYLPTRYIRTDATEHFRAEADAATAELKKIESKYASRPNVSPAGRTVERMRQLQATIDSWPRTEKLCRVGEQVAALRAEREQLTKRREQLQEQRRRKALAV